MVLALSLFRLMKYLKLFFGKNEHYNRIKAKKNTNLIMISTPNQFFVYTIRSIHEILENPEKKTIQNLLT